MAINTITKYYGADTYFNGNVTFYKDVSIQGDSLTLKNLTVKEQSTLENLSVSGISTLTTANVAYLTGVGVGTSIQVSSGNKLVGLQTGSIIYPGAIIQVVQTVKVDNWTSSAPSSGTTFYDVTGLSATITPSSLTSKILVDVVCQASTAYWEAQGRLTRNGSVLTGATGNQRGSRSRCTFSVMAYEGGTTGYWMQTATIKYLDIPESTSAQTYQVQLGGYSSYGVAVNSNAYSDFDSADYYGTPISTITLTEISG